jgi:hypothetical protein
MIPQPLRSMAARLVDALLEIDGVVAIVLGGSYARGKATSSSDVDLGLYYEPDAPFSIERIRAVATEVAVRPPTVTDFYGWGAWVNGGGWIQTQAGKIDLLYRNIRQVIDSIHRAEEGVQLRDYDQQPAHGFYSTIYLAETEYCVPIYDPRETLAALKAAVRVYPPKLKAQIIGDSLWSAEFTLMHAESWAQKGDIYGVAGCLTRAAANMTQALYAANEVYFTGDKGAMVAISSFPAAPANFVADLQQVLGCAGSTPDALLASVDQMRSTWRSVIHACGDEYQARFRI